MPRSEINTGPPTDPRGKSRIFGTSVKTRLDLVRYLYSGNHPNPCPVIGMPRIRLVNNYRTATPWVGLYYQFRTTIRFVCFPARRRSAYGVGLRHASSESSR